MNDSAKNMISVAEARDIINRSVSTLTPAGRNLPDALHHILAEDVHSLIDFPPFDQSNVDGYTFAFEDHPHPIHIVREIPAGSRESVTLVKGQGARIFTGAPVPAGADTVLMQEHARLQDGALVVDPRSLTKGDNVRPRGAEIKKGQLAVEKGTLLTPAAIGYMAGLGISKVVVYPMPVVGLILTGQELTPPGEVLGHGQIYESNSCMVKAALQAAGISGISTRYAEDNLEATSRCLAEALDACDLVLLVGGISVGDYDFVLRATQVNGVEQKFHRVKQKPGKPVFFGMKENKVIFGLPGNPSSVLTCLYEYVFAALGLLTKRDVRMTDMIAVLKNDHHKKPGLTHFLKGYYDGTAATPLGAQESYRLSSYREANCLICLQEDRSDFSAGEEVTIHLLPN